MFKIKICGVKLKSDVDAVAASPADAIGLNFFPPSVRFVDPKLETTRQLSVAAADSGLLRVGVFVNETSETIHQIVDQVGLDVIQLHGDEPVELATDLIGQGQQVIRAIKLPAGALNESLQSAIDSWLNAGCDLLFDADAGAQHGGSGKTIDWITVRQWAKQNPHANWTLAGGLTPDNVAEAIKASGAVSVDTASGVESQRGEKSNELIQDFAERAATEFENSGGQASFL